MTLTRNRAEQIAYLDGLLNCSSTQERRAFLDMIRPFGLTLPQFAVMATLERFQPGMLISDLSELTLTPASSMTHTLDRLAERGLVKRTAHPADRRAMLIDLTPEGHELVTKLRVIRRKHVAALCQSLSDEELIEFGRILEKMSLQPASPSAAAAD